MKKLAFTFVLLSSANCFAMNFCLRVLNAISYYAVDRRLDAQKKEAHEFWVHWKYRGKLKEMLIARIKASTKEGAERREQLEYIERYLDDSAVWFRNLDEQGWTPIVDAQLKTRGWIENEKYLEERYKRTGRATVFTAGPLGITFENPKFFDGKFLLTAQRGANPEITGSYYTMRSDIDWKALTADPNGYASTNRNKFEWQMDRYGNPYTTGRGVLGPYAGESHGHLFIVRGEDIVKHTEGIEVVPIMKEVITYGPHSKEIDKAAVGLHWNNVADSQPANIHWLTPTKPNAR